MSTNVAVNISVPSSMALILLPVAGRCLERMQSGSRVPPEVTCQA